MMSEFTNHKDERVARLYALFIELQKGESLAQLVADNKDVIDLCTPADIVSVVHRLVETGIQMPELKKGINKWLNLLYKTLSDFPYSPPEKSSFLGCMIENNRILDTKLQTVKPMIREFNSDLSDSVLKEALLTGFREIEKVGQYYLIKENILFPLIEKYVPEFRCLSVMWSFHDDIRRNLKEIINELQKKQPDLKRFNRLAGDIFFNIYAIRFREERILFPVIQNFIAENELNQLFPEAIETGFPFWQPEYSQKLQDNLTTEENKINLDTGNLTVEQIKLLFNHLPVDITYVDENDKVVYFSSPKKRIFPRSKAVIGRDVHNCHPPESVHVVEQIVNAFRNGKKDVASFWINMKGQQLLIQYLPVRDEVGKYRGVIEVSQEITEIRQLQGEKRLLDWED
jgi:hypothetical protein